MVLALWSVKPAGACYLWEVGQEIGLRQGAYLYDEPSEAPPARPSTIVARSDWPAVLRERGSGDWWRVEMRFAAATVSGWVRMEAGAFDVCRQPETRPRPVDQRDEGGLPGLLIAALARVPGWIADASTEVQSGSRPLSGVLVEALVGILAFGAVAWYVFPPLGVGLFVLMVRWAIMSRARSEAKWLEANALRDELSPLIGRLGAAVARLEEHADAKRVAKRYAEGSAHFDRAAGILWNHRCDWRRGGTARRELRRAKDCLAAVECALGKRDQNDASTAHARE
jgi:hypothetical protein